MRVAAGALKGKVLRYPKTGIRPTTELIRSALFNMVSSRIVNATVADFFCGAGALGIEAISRGAKIVYFFEKSNLALRYLKENLGNLPGAKIIRGDVLRKIKVIKDAEFDIMIADPPYLKGFLNGFIEAISQKPILAKEGLIILQHHKKEELCLPAEWYISQQKRHGETFLTVIRRKHEDSRLPG